VLVLGDSRIAEGFSATLANEIGSAAGLKFVSLAEPAASANTWYYMIREVDPTKQRYSAIIVPYGLGYEPNNSDPECGLSACRRFFIRAMGWARRSTTSS